MSDSAIFSPNSAIAQRNSFLMAKFMPGVKAGRATSGWSAMPISSAITGAVMVTGAPTSASIAFVPHGSIWTEA